MQAWYRGFCAVGLGLGLLGGCGGGGDSTPLPESVALQAPSRLEPGQPATVSAQGVGADTQWRWSWDFGDGTTSTEASPSHRYARPGRYELALTLSNTQGQTTTGRQTLTVGHFERLANRDCTGADRSGWCWQLPARAARTVLDVDFADAQRGLAVGELGLVASTSDGGRSWTRLPDAGAASLQLVRLSSTQTAYAVGNGQQLLRSTDGGRSWAGRGDIPLGQVDRLWLLDPQTVIARGRASPYVGALRTVISTDAGAHWRATEQVVSEVEASASLLLADGGHFVSRDRGVSFEAVAACCRAALASTVRTDGRIERIVHDASVPGDGLQPWRHASSSDGGRSFTVQAIAWPTLAPGSFVSTLRLHPSGEGLAIVYSPVVSTGLGETETWQLLRTNDGGRSWAPRLGPHPSVQPPPADPWIDGRSLFLTHEAGPSPVRQANTTVVFADGRLGMFRIGGELEPPIAMRRIADGPLLAGFGNTLPVRWYSSADEGQTWVALPGYAGAEDDLATITGLWFFDARRGLATQSGGSLLATDDGGRSWQPQGVIGGGFTGPYGLHFVTGEVGFMLADLSLYRSSDGGRQWQRITTLPLNVRQAQFIDPDHGWVSTSECRVDGQIGYCDDQIQRTTDGGRSWQRLPMAAGDYRPLAFADRRVGAVVDETGQVWRTGDAGDSWTQAEVDLPLRASVAALYFDPRGRGWILPRSGPPRVLRSEDEGRTWRTIPLPAPQDVLDTTGLRSIRMVDTKRGWIVGTQGLVLGTDDGGATWRRQPSGTERGLGLVFALDAMTVWVGGGHPSTVLTSSTGGDTVKD